MGNVAVSDNFFLRANLLHNKRDGYLDNLVAGERNGGKQDNFAARVAALWQLSSVTDLQLSFDQDRVDNAPRPAVGLSPWAACPLDPRCGQILNDVIDGRETADMWAVNAKLNHEISDAWSVKLISGYRTFETINKQDEDGTAEIDRYLDTDNIEDSDIMYSELQFNFTNERVNLVFGANYSSEDVRQDIPVNTNIDSVMRLVTGEIVADIESTFGVPIEFLTGGVAIDHLWDPVDMVAFMGLQGVDVTPEEVVLTGDLLYDLVAPSIPGPFFGPSFTGTPWSEYYFNEGDFTNWGLCGDVDFQVSNRWNVLFGLRYSNDEKTFSWRNPPNTANEIRPGTPDIVFVPIPGYEQARRTPTTRSRSAGRRRSGAATSMSGSTISLTRIRRSWTNSASSTRMTTRASTRIARTSTHALHGPAKTTPGQRRCGAGISSTKNVSAASATSRSCSARHLHPWRNR